MSENPRQEIADNLKAAILAKDGDAAAAEIEKLGLPLVCQGGIPDLGFTYLDSRDTLGHYLEFVWATPAGWAMVGWPEGRAIQ